MFESVDLASLDRMRYKKVRLEAEAAQGLDLLSRYEKVVQWSTVVVIKVVSFPSCLKVFLEFGHMIYWKVYKASNYQLRLSVRSGSGNKWSSKESSRLNLLNKRVGVISICIVL